MACCEIGDPNCSDSGCYLDWTSNTVQRQRKITRFTRYLPGQNHLDISLVDANDRDMFYKTISVAKKAVEDTILTEMELKEILGLK